MSLGRRHLPRSCAPGLTIAGIMPAMLGAVLSMSSPLMAAETVIPGAAPASISADALVAQAQALRQSGDLVTARELVLTALQRDPGHAAARTLLASIDSQKAGRPAQLDGDPAGGPTSGGSSDDVRLQATLAEARMQTARAELLAAGNRFEDAIVLLTQSQSALKPYVEHQAVQEESQRITALVATYQERLTAAHGRQARESREASRQAAEGRALHAQHGELALLNERIARVEELERKGFVESALAACRRLVDSHPDDRQVANLYARLITRSHVQRELTIEEQRAELLQETHERMERSLIPTGFDGWPVYASDWHLRHNERGFLDAPVKVEAWEEAINEKLSVRLSYNLVEQNAVEVLGALAKQVGVNLVIDPAVFANGDVVVTLKANEITFRNTLSWICRLANTRWYVDRGAVYIGGTQESTPVLAIYDVSELLFVPKDQIGKQLAFGGGAAGGGAGGGGAGFSLFAAPAEDEAAPAISPEDLVDLIQQAVSPTIWENQDYGITIRGTTLLVNAPTSTHLLIQEFIRSQAKQKSLLVRVNARWLTIKDGYLEEIGVDWRTDEFLQPAAIGATLLQNPGNAPHNNLTPTSNGYHRQTNQFDHGGSLVNTLPAAASVPNSALQAASGLNLQAMFIDSTLSSAILSAVERNTKGTILEAPEVVTMSGVRANTFMGTQYAYIGDYEASPPAGALGGTLDPDIGILNLGATLDIKPYVSSDGKYVTMEFRPAIASLQGSLLETITTQRFYPTGVDPDVGNGNGIIIGQVIDQDFIIELPNVLVRSVATTIMVPDGGTILVGGFGNLVEQSMSTKIPFLGHIPFLGRLFGKRGRYSDRYQLYLLADINIINYAELEAKL